MPNCNSISCLVCRIRVASAVIRNSGARLCCVTELQPCGEIDVRGPFESPRSTGAAQLDTKPSIYLMFGKEQMHRSLGMRFIERFRKLEETAYCRWLCRETKGMRSGLSHARKTNFSIGIKKYYVNYYGNQLHVSLILQLYRSRLFDWHPSESCQFGHAGPREPLKWF